MGREEDLGALRRLLAETPDHPPGEPRSITDPPVYDRKDPDMPQRYRFDPTINNGHILTIASIIVTGALSVGSGLWWTSGQLTRFQEQVNQFQTQLMSMRRDIDASALQAAERQRTYGPRIDGLERDNQVQGERIQNLSLAAADQRKVAADILTILGNIREDMATVKARLALGKRTELMLQQQSETR